MFLVSGILQILKKSVFKYLAQHLVFNEWAVINSSSHCVPPEPLVELLEGVLGLR